MTAISGIRINGGRADSNPRTRQADFSRGLFISWSLDSDTKNAFQSGFTAVLVSEGKILSELSASGREQSCAFHDDLSGVTRVKLSLTARMENGESAVYEAELYNALCPLWGRFLAAPKQNHVYFSKRFTVKPGLREAALFVCALGLYEVRLNSLRPDNSRLEPAHTDYSKTLMYGVYPVTEDRLREGENELSLVLGNGWRRSSMDRNPNARHGFSGEPMFSLCLRLKYAGETEYILTDESWLCREGPVRENDLFDGEVYDAAYETEAGEYLPARVMPAPEAKLLPMLMEPITENRVLKPRISWKTEAGTVYDMGVNICGVARVKLPGGLKKGQTLILRHGEELDDEGGIFTAPLRAAKAEDRYTAGGNEQPGSLWQPCFTYHGFRYIEAKGDFLPESIEAVELRTGLPVIGEFSCGSAAASRIHEICVNTERANQIGILTDCPQRDERQGWLNDASVRFEETPYNFDIGRIFPKILNDITDTQEAAGNIKDTAPFVFGSETADPVCSSFLQAAWQCLMHTGYEKPLRRFYPALENWEKYLLSRSENYICGYSNYGDWAGPDAFCRNDRGSWTDHRSRVTPGEYMSTGYMYLNAVLLARTAPDEDTRARWADTAEKIKAAMLNKWYDPVSGKICTGSQGCLSFALWLDIIPAEDKPGAAGLLEEDLKKHGLTTGNLCSRYILDVLAQNGRADAAWGIITNESYPSIGYMLQNEATTVWERFELKKDPGMNSHNHPMYASMDYWFYAYLLGMKPAAPGWRKIRVEPCFPSALLSASGRVNTPMGDVCVRWVKRFGKLTLWTQVPVGAECEIVFDGKTVLAGSGLTVLSKEI